MTTVLITPDDIPDDTAPISDTARDLYFAVAVLAAQIVRHAETHPVEAELVVATMAEQVVDAMAGFKSTTAISVIAAFHAYTGELLARLEDAALARVMLARAARRAGAGS